MLDAEDTGRNKEVLAAITSLNYLSMNYLGMNYLGMNYFSMLTVKKTMNESLL